MLAWLSVWSEVHMAQLMPLPLTVSCFSKIQIGFTFLVPAHPGSPGQRAVKRVCVCVSRLPLWSLFGPCCPKTNTRFPPVNWACTVLLCVRIHDCWKGFTHTHTHPFNSPLSTTTRVSRCQKGEINLDFIEARDSEWQWHQLGHIKVLWNVIETVVRQQYYAGLLPE